MMILLSAAGFARAAGATTREEQVELLRRRALAWSARNTPDARRMAMQCLEEATQLAPERADLQLELGRVMERMGFLKEARKRFEKVAAIHPDDVDGRIGLARIWRRDYLKYLDTLSLGRSVRYLREASVLRPNDPDIAIGLVPLLLERGDLPAALSVVGEARVAAPTRADVRLAEGLVAYRAGQVERADSAFGEAVPHMPTAVRERFEDIAPLATMRDTMTLHRLAPADQAEFLRRFWAELDPDLATSVNEARLAYDARVAQAYFLYYDGRRREWDMRGEVYVRYGPPAHATYNPVGSSGVFSVMDGSGFYRRFQQFPLNTLVWMYPELGMQVVMEDRLLSEHYLLPIQTESDPDPLPDPEVIAHQGDQFATNSGRGVFPTLPPGVHPVRLDGVIARFEGAEGPRVLALLATPGAPGDSGRASFAVLDSTRREVKRITRPLSPSLCDPVALRVADFASELPPGDYLVGLTIDDGRGGRGIVRDLLKLEKPTAALALSDIVVSCGRAAVDARGDQPPAVRLNANPTAEVAPGQALTVYFEAYHLRTGSDGQARLEFEYTVRNAARDSRVWIQRVLHPRPSIPDVSARREETQPGDIRRQFVEVPVQSLPPGAYRLDITVRDQLAGTERSQSVVFYRVDDMPGH